MILLVHGGAGSRSPGIKRLKKIAEALSTGFRIMQSGASALEAVAESIKVLEDSGIFNAGSGSNLQFDGVRRLDASLMEGRYLNAGSVIGLEGIRNPSMAARIIMDLPHVILTHKGAKNIADAHKIAPLPKPDTKALNKLYRIKKQERYFVKLHNRYFSTVGAVCLDRYGNLAAGSSTGGIPAMLPGRVGDTPVIGSGIYADNSLGAVSCTGTGEFIIRLVLAKEICMNMKSLSPQRASALSLRRISGLGGEAGVIVLNRHGKYAITHTTEYMASGYATAKGIEVQEGFNRISKKI